MITKVVLKNFQSHKDTEISFDKGLNAIIGTGDHGKSAVVKGILWVITNKPDGEEMISHWAVGKKDCSVKLVTENGYVERVRGKSNNYYDVNGKKLKAFGRNVPEEVLDFFNISDINYQTQFDPHFLLTSSKADVSKVLNSIANLEDIDKILQVANHDIKSIKSNEKHVSEDISSTKTELKSYKSLESLEEEIAKCELWEKTVAEDAQTKEKLSNILSKVSTLENSLDKYSKLDSLDLSEVEGLIQRLTDAKEIKISLGKTLETIASLRKRMMASKKATKAEKDLSAIKELDEKLTTLIKQIKSLRETLKSMKNLESSLEKLSNTIVEKEKEYTEVLGDKCPFCGSEVVK